MKKTIDLNCELEKKFGVYSLSEDALIMPYSSSANITCGAHAGDPLVMESAVHMAVKHGVRIGAHPGYSDLQEIIPGGNRGAGFLSGFRTARVRQSRRSGDHAFKLPPNSSRMVECRR